MPEKLDRPKTTPEEKMKRTESQTKLAEALSSVNKRKRQLIERRKYKRNKYPKGLFVKNNISSSTEDHIYLRGLIDINFKDGSHISEKIIGFLPVPRHKDQIELMWGLESHIIVSIDNIEEINYYLRSGLSQRELVFHIQGRKGLTYDNILDALFYQILKRIKKGFEDHHFIRKLTKKILNLKTTQQLFEELGLDDLEENNQEKE